jgi:hypothetical protein
MIVLFIFRTETADRITQRIASTRVMVFSDSACYLTTGKKINFEIN